MKKILFTALTVFGTAATAAAQGQIGIDINVKNHEGKKVVAFWGNHNGQPTDSAIVKNGRVSFRGNIDTAVTQAFIVFGDYDPRSRETNYTQAYVDAGTTTTIDVDASDVMTAVFRGGKTQTEKNELAALEAPARNKMESIYKQLQQTPDSAAQAPLRKQIGYYKELDRAAMLCFIKTHPDSYVSAETMRFFLEEMKYEEIKEIYDSFSPQVKACPDGQKIGRELATLAKMQPGAVAPDFTATDINGKQFTLSSLKGKVVIIDFWASWCVPCRRSNPHMRELYQKYHDRGLEMVYVSDDDSNPGAWRKAVEKDQLTGDGFHHVLRGLKIDRSKGAAGIDRTNDISDKYAVHVLPTKFLIDREGKMVFKIDSDEQLEQALEKLF